MGSKKNPPPPPKPVEESSESSEEEVEEEVEEEEVEEEEEEVEEKEPHHVKPQPSSSSATESDSDEDDNHHSTSHPNQNQNSVKRQATPPPEIVPNSEDDETESGDDDEEEADPASDSVTASAYTVKPITTVSVNSKNSKPAQKRVLESSKDDGKGSKDGKKAKTGKENDKKGKGGGGFPGRVWSEESEIVMLQGILDYQRENGPIRSADTGDFYEFIKGKLWDGVTKTQIGDKIKRLKAKYGKNVKKAKNGQDPIFSKAHDKKAFELLKQIWGVGSSSVSNGKEEKAKTKVVDGGKGGKKVSNAGTETKRVVEVGSKVTSDDPKGKRGSNDGRAMMDVDVDVNEDAKRDLVKNDELKKKGDVEGDFLSKFPTLCNSFDTETVSLKDYLHLIGSQNASELEEEWKQLQLEEMNVAAKRVILKGKQAKLVLDAMKKQ